MKRIHNFGAGPAILPVPVLEKASQGILELGGSGMSVLEISHRSKAYESIQFGTRDRLLKLMGLSTDEYTVLFLGGGASMQFAMLPLNYLAAGKTADYVNAGEWGTKAIKEAQKVAKACGAQIGIASTSEESKFAKINKSLKLTPGAAYLHYTTNNTIEGTQWHSIPDSQGAPLIADASSDILCRQMDFSRYSMIYAGAQKNLGPAGVTIVVIKKSFLEQSLDTAPAVLTYKTHAKADSLYNTPPAFAVYTVGLVLEWIESQGGLAAIDRRNQAKAQAIYAALDEFPEVYDPAVTEKSDRSTMNITWRVKNADREASFLAGAQELGMDGLKGHRAVGGFRASVYNAFPEEGCLKLAEYIRKFARS